MLNLNVLSNVSGSTTLLSMLFILIVLGEFSIRAESKKPETNGTKLGHLEQQKERSEYAAPSSTSSYVQSPDQSWLEGQILAEEVLRYEKLFEKEPTNVPTAYNMAVKKDPLKSVLKETNTHATDTALSPYNLTSSNELDSRNLFSWFRDNFKRKKRISKHKSTMPPVSNKKGGDHQPKLKHLKHSEIKSTQHNEIKSTQHSETKSTKPPVAKNSRSGLGSAAPSEPNGGSIHEEKVENATSAPSKQPEAPTKKKLTTEDIIAAHNIPNKKRPRTRLFPNKRQRPIRPGPPKRQVEATKGECKPPENKNWSQRRIKKYCRKKTWRKKVSDFMAKHLGFGFEKKKAVSENKEKLANQSANQPSRRHSTRHSQWENHPTHFM